LLPQLSHDLEVGTTLALTGQEITARLFRHDLTNEIYYDPTANNNYGANTNLDPTRRQGFGLDAKFRLSEQFRLVAQYQYVDAEFTQGINSGKELVMVPKNTLSAHLNWMADGQTAYFGVQRVSDQRYGGDFTNTCSALMPSYATLDARYSKTIGSWEMSVAGDNLTNRKYFTQAYGCMSGIYPSDGRQLKASLRYSF
jgi:iron complex outermembrane receptor protein